MMDTIQMERLGLLVKDAKREDIHFIGMKMDGQTEEWTASFALGELVDEEVIHANDPALFMACDTDGLCAAEKALSSARSAASTYTGAFEWPSPPTA